MIGKEDDDGVVQLVGSLQRSHHRPHTIVYGLHRSVITGDVGAPVAGEITQIVRNIRIGIRRTRRMRHCVQILLLPGGKLRAIDPPGKIVRIAQRRDKGIDVILLMRFELGQEEARACRASAR